MGIYRPLGLSSGQWRLHRAFVWSGDSLVAMYGSEDDPTKIDPQTGATAPELLARFVYAPGSRTPQYGIYPAATVLNPDTGDGGTEKTYRIVTDHLGSVRYVIDTQSGEIKQQLDYDAFGRVLRDSSPEFQPLGFAAGVYLRGPALTRFGARDYDPHTGRWTARDPILFGGGQDNLYAYCGNDPVNCVDPSGLAVETFWDLSWWVLSAGSFAADPNICTGLDLALDTGSVLAPGVPSKGPVKLRWVDDIVGVAQKWHRHHAIPKFLGGVPRQILTKLPDNVHREYHRVLSRELRSRGLNLPVGGKRGSTQAWREFFERNPGTQDNAFDAVLAASRSIDAQYGTKITQDVWGNIQGDFFTCY